MFVGVTFQSNDCVNGFLPPLLHSLTSCEEKSIPKGLQHMDIFDEWEISAAFAHTAAS